MVHRAVVSKRPAAQGRFGRIGDHRVARCSADAFAEAVGEAHQQHLPGRGGDANQRAGNGAAGIADHDKDLPLAGPVRQRAGP